MNSSHAVIPLALAASTLACQSPTELPPVQVEGSFVSYAADEQYEICPGTVAHAEEWMEAVAGRLGIDPAELLPTTYYFVDPSVLEEQCPRSSHGAVAGCTRREGDRILVFSRQPLHRHELVHALHLSAWPRRQPILHEGLAHAYDDTFPDMTFAPPSEAIDAAIEAESAIGDNSVELIGAYLIYWIVQRHGADGLSRLWQATSRPSSAADFRAAFEQELGETLDTMLAVLGDESGSQFVTCVGEVLPWTDGRWTVSSPRGCEDGAVGIIGEDRHSVSRYDLVEIGEAGYYELAAYGELGQAIVASVTPCGDVWPDNQSLPVDAEQPTQYYLTPGVHRVETVQSGPDQPTFTVEIRPVN